MVSEPEGAEYLSVASYNVHRCVGIDGLCDPGRIAAVIRSLNATIIGLQEVDSSWFTGNGLNQVDYLTKTLGLEAVAGPTILYPKGYYGNLLLTRHNVRSVRQIDLSFAGREPRAATEVNLDVRGRRVRVIVTHLGLARIERRSQAVRLCQTVEMNTNRLTILLGDFNEWTGWAQPLRCLSSNFGRCSVARTFPSRLPIFGLDRVFVSPSETFMRAEVCSTPLSRMASDHLPIKAVIRLK